MCTQRKYFARFIARAALTVSTVTLLGGSPLPSYAERIKDLTTVQGVRSNAHGDLLCHVIVETPVNLTARQKELLQEFEAISSGDNDANPENAYWIASSKIVSGACSATM